MMRLGLKVIVDLFAYLKCVVCECVCVFFFRFVFSATTSFPYVKLFVAVVGSLRCALAPQ